MKIQTFTIVAGTCLCNAKCPYCISKMTPLQGVGYEIPKTNWINFHKACRLAQMNNVTTVLITGKGEPLLYPNQISDFLKNLKQFDFPLIEIQTNGLVLGNNFEKYKKYLIEWRKLGLNTIAFSIVHYERDKNKQIYTPNGSYIDLPSVIEKLHRLGYSVRLSCIMLNGFIDSIDKVNNLIQKAKEWSVEQLTIRSVTTPKKSENKEVYDWTKKRIIPKEVLSGINKFLEKNGNKIMTLDCGGIVYDYNGQNICMSDCLTIKPDTEDLRQLIFFPDGHLRYDWQYKGAVLL